MSDTTDVPADAVHETWDDVYAKSVRLADLIVAHCQETGERFDAMIVVPRGAYYPVNIIARRLDFGATDLLQAAVRSYEAPGRQAEFQTGQLPTAAEVRGKNLLIIDEVCDSGRTLQWLVDDLKGKGASLIRSGVLHYKPARSQTDFRPDWAVETTDKWIVYPWEPDEQPPGQAAVKRPV